VNEKGVPEKNEKPYDKVTGDILTKVKTFFKPKYDDLKKPKKEKEDDIKLIKHISILLKS
jgi:hypothetical protein